MRRRPLRSHAGRATCKRAVVVAGAKADAAAAPVEGGERHEQQIRLDLGALRRRFGDIHGAQQNSVAGLPAAKDQRLTSPPGDGQSGKQTLVGEGGEKRQRVRFVGHRIKGRDDFRVPIFAKFTPSRASRSANAWRISGGVDLRRSSASALRRALALAAAVLAGVGVISGTEARSRESRWTVIPGAYVSRWAPCARAHGQGQGQLPLGSYGPEEYVLTHPPAPQSPI